MGKRALPPEHARPIDRYMTPYSNSRIMRRCGQLGIPYAEVMGSPFFAHQGVVAPELFVQYMEGVEGYTGSPARRRPLDPLKTLPHDLQALRALLHLGPVKPLEPGADQQCPKRDQESVVGHWSGADRTESTDTPAASPSLTAARSSTPPAGDALDLTDLIADPVDELTVVEIVRPSWRELDSYIPPELPRERWRVLVNAGHDEEIDWSIQGTDIVIDGENRRPERQPKRRRRNNDFKKRGKNGRKSKRRARSIRDTWVSVDSVACRAWCDAVFEKGFCVERDIDELIAECDGDTSVEDLHIRVMRALEGFGLEPKSEFDVVAAFWDQPTDVDADDLFAAVDAALNRSVLLPGTQRLTMERASDEAELQALLAARQEFLQEILSHDSALKAAIHLRLSGPRDCRTDVQTLSAWIASGRPTHGKAWRTAITAVQALWLSLVEFADVVNESVQIQRSDASTRHLVRAFEQYRALLTKTRTRYLPYVRRIVSRNLARHEEMEDAFQAATFGLFRALDLLNGKSAGAFRGYVTHWINQRFYEWRANHGVPIRIPLNRLAEVRDFERTKRAMRTTLGDLYDQDALADRLGWQPKKVAEFEHFLRTPVSLSDRRHEAGWGSSPAADFASIELREVIDAAISGYDQRDAKVVRLYYGLDGGDEFTLEEIGSLLGVTRERVRQLRDRMLDRLRASARRTGLHHFADLEDES